MIINSNHTSIDDKMMSIQSLYRILQDIRSSHPSVFMSVSN